MIVPAVRSLLFVPGNRPERFDKAAASGADAIILDLEDAVPVDQRATAGASVAQWLQARAEESTSGQAQDAQRSSVTQPSATQPSTTRPSVTQCWVRVPQARERPAWLASVIDASALTGVVLPKVESPDDLSGWSLPIIAQIESARGVLALDDIARAGSSLVALAIGPEDLSVSLRVSPSVAALSHACARAVVAARAFDRQVYACPGSIGEFRDLARWRDTLAAGRALGSDGMMCIHPSQVAPVNEVFSPDADTIAWALQVAQAWRTAQADGLAAVSVAGRMVDPPVAQRAHEIVAAAQRYGLIPPG